MNKLSLATLLLLLGIHLSPLVLAQQTQITTDQTQEQVLLETAQSRWNSFSPPLLNYVYEMSEECDVCCWQNTCVNNNYPWRVQVNNDVAGTKTVNSKNDAISNGLTIAQVFSEIQAALNDPNKWVEAAYDPYYGYPLHYRVQTGVWPDPDKFDSASIRTFEELDASQSSEFATSRSLWARQRRTSYDFTHDDKTVQNQNIRYPLRVKVRNNRVSSATDALGQPVNFAIVPVPHTFDEWFTEIARELGSRAPYVENDYDGIKGYPNGIYMLDVTGSYDEVTITNYQDTNLV